MALDWNTTPSSDGQQSSIPFKIPKHLTPRLVALLIPMYEGLAQRYPERADDFNGTVEHLRAVALALESEAR